MSGPGNSAYRRLEERFARISHVGGAQAVLNWDSAAIMPAGGAAARADQLATLAAIQHEMLTSPAIGDLLEAAADERLEAWQAANLREMRRDWRHAAAVPGALVEARTRARAACEMAWREARPAGDFGRVAGLLAEVLRLTREVAAAGAAAFGTSPYDALLDEFEPDGRIAEIEPLFADLASFLPGFLAEVEAGQPPAAAPPPGPFPVERQRALGITLMTALGFEFDHGRLDVSSHPFTGGVPDDVRITTRYGEGDFHRSLMGVLHETGHALYERGLPAEWRDQPVGRARGMSLHESQSLLVEMQVSRSPAFMRYAAPLIAQAFGAAPGAPGWDADSLRALTTRVGRSFIRVDADEVTYPAHIILRTRLERALVAGEMEVADIPAAWNEGMVELLGILPPSDREGCLQDIHWYDGLFGYFPTYTLGAMTAAQLYGAARAALPGLEEAIARGDFAPLLAWLRQHVHAKGSLLSAREIVIAATGAPLGTGRFKDHLRARYLG